MYSMSEHLDITVGCGVEAENQHDCNTLKKKKEASTRQPQEMLKAQISRSVLIIELLVMSSHYHGVQAVIRVKGGSQLYVYP